MRYVEHVFLGIGCRDGRAASHSEFVSVSVIPSHSESQCLTVSRVSLALATFRFVFLFLRPVARCLRAHGCCSGTLATERERGGGSVLGSPRPDDGCLRNAIWREMQMANGTAKVRTIACRSMSMHTACVQLLPQSIFGASDLHTAIARFAAFLVRAVRANRHRCLVAASLQSHCSRIAASLLPRCCLIAAAAQCVRYKQRSHTRVYSYHQHKRPTHILCELSASV